MDYTPLQFIFLFGAAVFFSSVALDRETVLSSLVASLFWLLSGVCSFVVGPSSVGMAFGWSMGLVSFVFMGVFMYRLTTSYSEGRRVKFDTWGPM